MLHVKWWWWGRSWEGWERVGKGGGFIKGGETMRRIREIGGHTEKRDHRLYSFLHPTQTTTAQTNVYLNGTVRVKKKHKYGITS